MSNGDRSHHALKRNTRVWSIALWAAVAVGGYWYVTSPGRANRRTMAARRLVDQTRPMRPDGRTLLRYPPIDGPIASTGSDFEPAPKPADEQASPHSAISIRSLARHLPQSSWVLFQTNFGRLKAIPCVKELWPILNDKLVGPALSHFGLDPTETIQVEAALSGHDLQDWDSFPLWRIITRYSRVFGPKVVLLAKTNQSLLSVLKRYAANDAIEEVSIHGVRIYRRNDGTNLALLGPGIVLGSYRTPISPFITETTASMKSLQTSFLAEIHADTNANHTLFSFQIHAEPKVVTLTARLSGGKRFIVWRRRLNQCLKELRESLWARKSGLHFFLNRAQVTSSARKMTVTIPLDPTCSRLQVYIKKTGK